MKSRAPKFVPSPKENLPKRSISFPIVAIGASAGGLEAYKEFFLALPPDTGMGYVLIQHLDPSHHSMLTEIIAKATKMPVEEVKSGVAIQPNRVYVIPPNKLMALENCTFRLSPRGKTPGQHLAVNFFMRSLAREEKSRAIGIVLSGTGADGTLGLEEIKAEGGITFAQEPPSARYDGMPRSAIDSGCVDFVLAPKDIAKELRRIQHHPYVRAERQDAEGSGAQELAAEEQGKELADSVAPRSHEKDFTAILGQLRKSSGVDFSQYKPNTIHRRALRRMVVLKLDSMLEYTSYLKEHSDEGQKLYDDVLIPVTSFFRDFEAFEALKQQVYPAIVKDKANKGTIRMWAPGCSTGEETYSLAMTLLEFLGDRASSFHVQIFGTDLNDKGIQKARTGLYRESIAEEISPERMQRFFVKVDEGYRVNKGVRDMCVFARQNLANDPPFSQMNVVACRNLLIYIQPVLQKKIIPILHYALKPSGFLVLGGSESVASFPDLFSTVDKKHRIYAKKAITSRLHYDFAQSYYPAQSALDAPGRTLKSQALLKDDLDVQAEADRLVLKHHAPVGVVVNGALEVVQFRGRTTPYLEPAPGKPSLNLLKLARNGLAIELRTLIAAAAKKGASVRKDDVPFDGNGHKRMLDLSVTPLGEKEREKGQGEKRFFLILFDDVTPRWTPPAETASPRRTKAGAADRREVQRLKQELANTQDALRSSVESEDSMKEEFQSANEEILSANEELQSTNEELETAKEEMQSANEELNTLNAELRSKNSELHDLGNDISNLLNSTRIPVVMLDRRLSIRRITPAATRLFKVLPSDIGRPFADIKLNVEASDLTPRDLESSIAQVLETLQPVEREVRDLDGHWHGLSVLPYRTQDNKIDGVVLALQDIDAVKRSEQYLQAIIENIPTPLLVLDADLRTRFANETFCTTFQVNREETVGQLLYRLGNEQWNVPALTELLEKVLPEHNLVKNFSVSQDFPTVGRKTMLVSARRLEGIGGQRVPLILLTIEDITERSEAEIKLRESEKRLHDMIDALPVAVYTTDAEGWITHFNPASVALAGRMPELGNDKWSVTWKLFYPDGGPMAHSECPMAIALKENRDVPSQQLIAERPDGTRSWVEVHPTRLHNSEGRTTGGVNMIVDITERRQAEAALIKSEKLAASGRMAAALAHEINNPLQAITNLVDLLRHSAKIGAEDRVYAAMAADELARVTHLTRQSLSFYRETSSPVAIDMEEVVASILSLYAKRFGEKKIAVNSRYEAGGASINSYPGAIRQVLTTVLVNATEAVQNGGTIAIRVGKSFHGRDLEVRGVRVTVADDGAGIATANLSRIFEPFFTTKGERGIGLGLWVARGIIDELGGTIGVRSSVRSGKSGTCFSIFLPNRMPDKIQHAVVAALVQQARNGS